jgi:integrase
MRPFDVWIRCRLTSRNSPSGPCRRVSTFPTITPHDLRHSAGSLAVSVRANVKAVQRMLGHAKASMTLDIYADLFDEDLDQVADRLNEAIKVTTDAQRSLGEAPRHIRPELLKLLWS